MRKPEFIYVSYIETTPERLWEALTNSAFTKRYWFDTEVRSDWKVGSPFALVMGHFRATGKSHTSIATCSFHLTLTESASRLLRFIVFAAQLICQSIRHRVGLHPHLQPGRS